MKRLLKALRWPITIFATLLTFLPFAFYAEEDWRGARDWAACQRDLAAKGETLDLRQLIPPGNPADDLSIVPIFAEMYQMERDYEKTKKQFGELHIDNIKIGFRSNYSSLEPKAKSYLKGEPIDLVVWQRFYHFIPEAGLPMQIRTPAQDVLQALGMFDSELNQIDIAVSNPNAYWPVNYERPFDSYLGGITRMIQIAKILQLRAVAHLENHEPDLAEKDFLFSFRLNHPLAQRCFLVNYLVMAGVRAIDNSILWEGMRRHTWNDNQLHEMEAALASEDMLALAPKAFRTERASSVQTMVFVQGQGPSIFQTAGLYDEEGIEALCSTWYLRPSGWWNQDRRHYAFGMQDLINSIDLDKRTLGSGAFDTKEISTWKMLYTPLAETALPANAGAGRQIARAEAYRRLARLACRVEEYRIAHGAYPDKLDDLPDLPAHLNQEVLSEQPLQYHRQGDGYRLYSLGWDQKDDGGTLDPKNDKRQGDWPWPSP